jgi:hypothetical protein
VNESSSDVVVCAQAWSPVDQEETRFDNEFAVRVPGKRKK